LLRHYGLTTDDITLSNSSVLSKLPCFNKKGCKFMLFTPKWAELSGSMHILNRRQLSKLEKLRQEFDLPHETFGLVITASSEFGKIIMERDYHNLKKKYPNLSEKEILTSLLKYENQCMEQSGSSEVMTDEQVELAMIDINNFDALCNFIIELEHKEQPQYYKNEIGSKIESIINTKGNNGENRGQRPIK
jgi:hypothetical protein